MTIGLLIAGAAASGNLIRLNWEHDGEGSEPALAARAAYGPEIVEASSGLFIGPLTPLAGPTGTLARSALEVSGDATRPPSSEADVTAASMTDLLDRSFADYPLGDLDRNGSVTIRDTLITEAIRQGGIATDEYDRYHADLTGDYVVGSADVTASLLKAVDPTITASLVVKPGRLTYLDLVQDKPVLVGNGGSAPFAGLSFAGESPRGQPFEGTIEEPIAGHSAVYTVSSEPNDAFGQLHVATVGQASQVIVGNIVILIAGQSNASGHGGPMIPALQDGGNWPEVRALANDYLWKPAVEPLDSSAGQLDAVSADGAAQVSPGVQAARLLNRGSAGVGIGGTDRFVYLIPAALGGSSLAPSAGVGWYLGDSDLIGSNRSTLFGSAAYRGLVSAGLKDMPAEAGPNEHAAEGGPVTAVYWYQGETDSRSTTRRSAYTGDTSSVFAGFEAQFETAAGKPVIIYAQLAPHGWDPSYPEGDPDTEADAEAKDRMQMDIAERQRRMEEGAYTGTPFLNPSSAWGSPRANSFMVVTNDLPRVDRIHLSSSAQTRLAERIALAYQEHALGMDVDGTGPRLTGLSISGKVVTVAFDAEIAETAAIGPLGYGGFFTAWDGVPIPNGPENPAYGDDSRLDIIDVRRHPDDPKAVQLTLATTPAASVYVRYMRPFEPTLESSYLEDVVRGLDSGLPLPSFGPLRVP